MFTYLKKSFVRKSHIPTQREQIAALLAQLNGAIAELPQKPSMTFHPETGQIDVILPEQMPDEALALPKPEKDAA